MTFEVKDPFGLIAYFFVFFRVQFVPFVGDISDLHFKKAENEAIIQILRKLKSFVSIMFIQQLKDKIIEKGDIPLVNHVLIENHNVFSLFFLQNLVLN